MSTKQFDINKAKKYGQVHVIKSEFTTQVWLYNTLVVLIQDGQVSLNAGGFKTMSTRTVINNVLKQSDLNLRVVQKDFCWFVEKKGFKTKFHDGITFDLNENEVETYGNIALPRLA